MLVQEFLRVSSHEVLHLGDDVIVSFGCHAFQFFVVDIGVPEEPLFVGYL